METGEQKDTGWDKWDWEGHKWWQPSEQAAQTSRWRTNWGAMEHQHPVKTNVPGNSECRNTPAREVTDRQGPMTAGAREFGQQQNVPNWTYRTYPMEWAEWNSPRMDQSIGGRVPLEVAERMGANYTTREYPHPRMHSNKGWMHTSQKTGCLEEDDQQWGRETKSYRHLTSMMEQTITNQERILQNQLMGKKRRDPKDRTLRTKKRGR